MDDLTSLVSRAGNGDERAFGMLVSQFRGLALRYAHTILHDWELAQDAVQDSFVQAHVHLNGLREPGSFPVWLRTIVSRCCGRILRVKRPPTVNLDEADGLPSDSPTPLQLVTEREFVDRVHRAVAELPDGEREAVRLFYMDGFSQVEVAETLGIPVSAVNNRLHSSRSRLRLAIAGEPGPVRARRRRMPSKPGMEERIMLKYATTTRRLLKGDARFTIRTMLEDDIPAMRKLDDEISAGLELANACRAPGNESCPGGPWAETEELRRHFRKYQAAGNITLLVEDVSGKLVGFADLWAADEPEPFGKSLDVECIDFLWEYYTLGIETVLLEEAEKVAVAAGLPALDIGTNTSSGDYSSLRRFGMRIFYECDEVRCDCRPLKDVPPPPHRIVPVSEMDMSGLLRINHWCPANFSFDWDTEPGRPGAYEFTVAGQRVIADFWRLWDVESRKPISCELYAPVLALSSSAFMTEVLDATAVLAAHAGADEIPLPAPSEVALEKPSFPVLWRVFEYAWMRKGLTA